MSVSNILRRSCVRISSPSSSIALRSSVLASRGPNATYWQRNGRRCASTTAASSDDKIEQIVGLISELTLLETATLVTSLKTRLNIPDMPVASFAAGPAAAAPAAPVEEEEAAPVVAEKTLFNLKLESFDAAAKPKVIKEIKSMLGLSLVDSKKFVESAPKLMKEGVPKEDAEKIIKTLKDLGAVVSME